MRTARSSWRAAAGAALLWGCEGESPPNARDAAPGALMACDDDASTWECPQGWAPAPAGGCAPAVLLCGPDGGAAPGSCTSRELREPTSFALSDGGVGWRFRLLPDGGIGGGWNASDARCPAAWEPQADGLCAPALRACPEGSAAVPSGQCTRTAESDCPATEFPPRTAEMVGAEVAHVRAGAAAEGADGSEARPYPTLRMAIERTGAGTWLLLAAGSYRESIMLTSPRRIVGVCAARTRIEAPGRFALTLRADALLQSVTVAGSTLVEGADLAGRDLVLASPQGYALRVQGEGSTATLRGVRFGPIDDLTGAVVQVAASGAVALSEFAMAGGVGGGIFATAGQVDLADGVIRGFRKGTGVEYAGRAVHAVRGSRVTAARLLVDDNQDQAVAIYDEGSSLLVQDSVIQNTGPVGPQGGGKAVEAKFGATATLERVRMVGNANATASAFDAGVLTLSDCVVRGTRPRPNGTAGRGIDAHHGGVLHARRVLIEGSHQVAVFSYDGSRVTLDDVAVLRTDAPPSEPFGAGLSAIEARLDARRVLVEDSTEIGVAVIGGGASATFEDVIVRGVRPSRRGFAMGFVTTWGARATASRVAVVGARGVGLSAQPYGIGGQAPGTRFEASDVYVGHVANGLVQYNTSRPDLPPMILASYGVNVGPGTAMALTRCLVEDAEVGVALFGPLSLSRSVVARVARAGVLNRTFTPADSLAAQGLACRQVSRARVEFVDDLLDAQLPVTASGF